MIRKLSLIGLMFLAGLSAANAQYPDKPVKIVVPVAAGGGVDARARLLLLKLSERLNQQFVNRPGAAGRDWQQGGDRLARRRHDVALHARSARQDAGFDVIASTPQQFAKQLQEDVERWGPVAKAASEEKK